MDHQADHFSHPGGDQFCDEGDDDVPSLEKSNASCQETGPDEKYPAQLDRSQDRGFEHITGKDIETDHDKKQKRKSGRHPVNALVKIFVNIYQQLKKMDNGSRKNHNEYRMKII